jgi:pimeloyl-ACP methyl ester carboxylesterase
MSLHIERSGQGEKIIFVHGSGCSGRMWHGQRDYLNSSTEVVLVDLPGHGESPGNGCDSVEEYAEVVYSGVIEGLSLGQTYVVGHSLGGAIAMSLALSHPTMVKGLILIGTGAKLRVLPDILEGIARDKEKTVRNIVELSFSNKAPAALKSVDFEETMKCGAEVIYKDFNACDHFNIMDSVGSLSVPTLILCGTEDSLTLPKYSSYLNREIKGSRLVLIDGAGHMVMREKPEEVNRAVEEFIRRR